MNDRYWFLRIVINYEEAMVTEKLTVYSDGYVVYWNDGDVFQDYLTDESLRKLKDYLFVKENLLDQRFKDLRWGFDKNLRCRVAVRRPSKRLLDGYARNNFLDNYDLTFRVKKYVLGLPRVQEDEVTLNY